MPDDVFADLLTAGIQAFNAVDHRGPVGVAGQADFGQAALGVQTGRVQPPVGAVVKVVHWEREVRKFDLLQYRTEIRRVRVQLHDGDAVGGAERGQAT